MDGIDTTGCRFGDDTAPGSCWSAGRRAPRFTEARRRDGLESWQAHSAPSSTLCTATAEPLALKPCRNHASAGMSTCVMRPLAWMSTWCSGLVPELTNLCGA